MPEPRTIKVFIASPGDLAVERRAFKDVIDELNAGFARGADVRFEPLGWEDALSTVGRRSQAVINQDIDACDVFVLVMWRRWGREAPDAAPYSSYTEEEFYRALARNEKLGKPTIFVFFKHLEPGQMADPGPQLEKVLAFRKKLEATRKVLYRGFTDEIAFRVEIDKHLVAFTKGECETSAADANLPMMPDSIKAEVERHRSEAIRAIQELEKLKAEAKLALMEAEQARAVAKDATTRAEAAERVGEARAVKEAVARAEDAAKAALDGRIEEARQGFAKSLDGTINLRVISLGFEFFTRIGELDEAERLLRRWLAISGPEAQTPATAAAYGNLGTVLQTRGDLAEAEAMHRKSLAIEEKLGRAEGMASDYGNLGTVLQTRGDLDGAEEMYRKSLAIEEKLGGLEGMAKSCCNLGLILKTRGDLDGAEEMLRKSLAINDKLGRVEGMAIAYSNLAVILKSRGDVDGARAMWSTSRALYTKLGAQHMVNRVQGWIDGLM